VLLPDDLMWGRPGCLSQMVEAYHKVGGNIVCVEEVPREKTASYGIIAPGASDGPLTEVKGLVEKPRPEEAPSTLSIIGRYILQPEVLETLGRHERGAGGEIQLTDAMAALIGRQPFHGLRVDAVRYDCGDKAGFVTANVALALEREDIGPKLRDFLAELG
jgi:UTP--glucose-1-phosphate uridylyltransferase